MTKQKIFEVLNSITKLDGDILAQVKTRKEDYTETNNRKYSYAGNEGSFVALLNLLESDIKQEEYLKAAKASGKTATEKKKIAAAKKILSANSEYRPRMQYAAVKDGRQIVVNPYQIVRFNTVLPLPVGESLTFAPILQGLVSQGEEGVDTSRNGRKINCPSVRMR